MPWASSAELAIVPECRREVVDRLPFSEMAVLVASLSERRSANLQALEWRRGPNRNALDALSYSSVLASADGRTALTTEVMIALEGATDSSYVGCANFASTT